MRALVLSGGGSRGAYQAGCWKALDDGGFRPDAIYGTSAGAINGAMIAAGLSHDEIGGWWGRLRQKDLLRVRKDVWKAHKWTSFYETGPLRGLLEEHLDLERLRAGIPLYVTAVDLQAGNEVVWGPDRLEIAHFMASMALLPGLPAIDVDGRLHADGGHWNALPLRHALEASASHVEVLLHDPIEPHAMDHPLTVRDVIRRQGDIVWHGRQQAEWEALSLRMSLPTSHPKALKPAKVNFHAPDPPLENEILSFDPAKAQEMYVRGYEETGSRMAQTLQT